MERSHSKEESSVALVSTISDISSSVWSFAGGVLNNVFGSSDQRDDSTVISVDDDLDEERIYNQTIACITNFNTYINESGPYSYMHHVAQAYVGNGVGHMLPEALASTMDEVRFVQFSQMELIKSKSQMQKQMQDTSSSDFSKKAKRRLKKRSFE